MANHALTAVGADVYAVWHPDLPGDGVTEFEILPAILAEIAETSDPRARNRHSRGRGVPFIVQWLSSMARSS